MLHLSVTNFFFLIYSFSCMICQHICNIFKNLSIQIILLKIRIRSGGKGKNKFNEIMPKYFFGKVCKTLQQQENKKIPGFKL